MGRGMFAVEFARYTSVVAKVCRLGEGDKDVGGAGLAMFPAADGLVENGSHQG